MATTTLHLVRHAEPEPTGEDPKLSESGRAQAAKVAAFRSSAGASEVLHGSRRRSIETATIIGAELGVPATASSHAEDLTPIPTDWDTVPARYHETLRSVPAHEQDLNGTRLDHAYDGFGTLNEQDRTVIMVTHNFVIGWFIRRTLDAPWWRWIGLNQHHASITAIQWSTEMEPRLLRSNEHGFL